MNTKLVVTDKPEPNELGAIGENLSAFNDADVGPSERRTLAVLVRDEAGALKAGINGYTGWGWLFTQWLWVDESLRGQGMAGRMLQAAEDEAKARGCHAAHSLVGAALCCEWAAKRPPASIRSQDETGNPPDSDTAHH